MDEKNPDEPLGDGPPSAASDATGPKVEERKRDYDEVKEESSPTREYSFSFSYNNINADVKSRRQC